MSPRNLVLTKAELTDKPYEVQLEVLRWIKRLVSSLVDSAVLACDDGHNTSTRHDGGEGVVASLVEAADDSKGEETSGCFKEDCVEANADSERASVGQIGGGGGRRKRAKTRSQEAEQGHAVGSVVECFHADDGLWYPAQITAVNTSTVETAPSALSASSEASPKDDTNRSSNETLSCDMTRQSVEIAQTDETVSTASASTVTFLDVIFLGYGNTATVPVSWVKDLSSPEVVQWCRENLPDEDETEAPVLSVDGNLLSTELLIAGSSDVSTASADSPSEVKHNGAGDKVKTVKSQNRNKQPGDENDSSKKNKNNNNSSSSKKKGKNKKKNNGKGSRQGGGGKGVKKKPDGLGFMELDEKSVRQWGTRSRSPYPHVPSKYWGQRYRYFSRFDDGVTMDKEGWYSVTPEAIARHIAERVCSDIVVDPFVGCGGNAVQFALVSHLVIAIDLDPVKLEHARRNAAVYGVENRIEFILGDAMKILPTLQADTVFLSPPWGGPSYQGTKTFDLHSMIPAPLTAVDIFRKAREVTPNVVFFLPRNVDVEQVAGLPAKIAATSSHQEAEQEANVGEMCELEQQFLNGKLKTTAAYYGKDIVGVGVEEPAPKVVVLADESQDQPMCVENGNTNGDTNGDVKSTVPTRGSGHHVRFIDEDSDEDDRNVATAAGAQGSSGGRFKRRNSVGGDGRRESISQQREDALYEVWMASTTKR